MQIFLIYLFLFLVGCIIGWLIEVIYRRYFTAKKWVNPGFMKGPWLPLYGFGTITMFTMCYLCVSFFPSSMHFYNPQGNLFDQAYKSGANVNDLIPISLMWISMVLLEFIAGIIFIKGFRIKLWDYSNLRGNILGVICPLYNILWLIVAVIFYYGINPFLFEVSTHMHTYMFGGDGEVAHFGFIFFLGIIYGLLIWDFVTSIGLFSHVIKFAKNSGVLARYEEMKAKWLLASNQAKEKLNKIKPKKVKKVRDNKFKDLWLKINFIDIEKEKNKTSNYDENGRPIKEE